MVNETYGRLTTIDGNTSYNIRRRIPAVNILKCVAVNNGEIFYVKTIYGINACHYLVVSFLNGMCTRIHNAVFQTLIDCRGNRTLFR